MSPEERKKHAYLGDGVYVEWDGFHFILRTDSHKDNECRNKIYLEQEIAERLDLFVKNKLLKNCDE